MSKDDLLQDIGTLLIQDKQISSHPWEHLVIVAQVKDRSAQVDGFAYPDSGEAIPTGPRNFDIIDKFEALCKVMQEPGKSPWKACLLRIENESGHISIDFEYDHPEKWLITPATVKQMAETLRPDMSK